MTNKGESGFGKASDRVKAKDHRPQGIPVVVRWGALSVGGEKLDRWKVIIGFPLSIPSALVKRCVTRYGLPYPLNPGGLSSKYKK